MSDTPCVEMTKLPSPGDVLQKYWGYEDFRPGQLRVIENVIRGSDALLVMPTGGGKSLCFQVPSLCMRGVTLVVSPLVALMKDQVDTLVSLGIPATFINSSISDGERRSRVEGMRNGAYKLVYIAPERLDSASFFDALRSTDVSLIAIDEAHCISQWGHNFRPAYRRIDRVFRACTKDGERPPVMALTATATPEVQDDIVKILDMEDPFRLITGFDRPNLNISVQKQAKGTQEFFIDTQARKILGSADGKTSEIPVTVWYAGTRTKTEAVAARLNELAVAAGHREVAVAYHAGMKDSDREKVQEGFMSGEFPWVVATNAFGMGIDKADIRYVVHICFPGSIEAYYQEIGRAGRDGKDSECILAFIPGAGFGTDEGMQWYFIDIACPPERVFQNCYSMLKIVASQYQKNPRQGFRMTYDEFCKETQSRYGKGWAIKGQISTVLTKLKSLGAFDAPRRGWMRIPEKKISQRSLEDLGIDFAALDAKRVRDELKLEAMLAYADSDDPRIEIRRYFGEDV